MLVAAEESARRPFGVSSDPVVNESLEPPAIGRLLRITWDHEPGSKPNRTPALQCTGKDQSRRDTGD